MFDLLINHRCKPVLFSLFNTDNRAITIQQQAHDAIMRQQLWEVSGGRQTQVVHQLDGNVTSLDHDEEVRDTFLFLLHVDMSRGLFVFCLLFCHNNSNLSQFYSQTGPTIYRRSQRSVSPESTRGRATNQQESKR